MKKILLLAALTILVTQVAACGTREAAPGQISVAGQASRSVVPDQAVWVVTVVSTHKDLKLAKEDNDAKLKAVLKAGHEIAEKEENVEASRLFVDRQYNYDQKSRQREFSHFSVRRTVKIRLSDLDRFEEALDLLIKAADVELWFSYEISNEHKLRREIQLEALDDARDKASALARRAGRDLGPVLSISEHAPQSSPYPGPMAESKFSLAADSQADSASPEARELTAAIHVIYQMK